MTVDTTSLTIIIVIILLIILTAYLLLKFFGKGSDEVEEGKPVFIPRNMRPIDDETFTSTFTAPMIEDGLNDMDDGLESVRLACQYYENSAWVESGQEYHGAIKSFDSATRKFRDVLGMIEDPENADVKKATQYLSDCKRFRNYASDMEKACDAMVEERPDEASKLGANVRKIEKEAAAWQKEHGL